MYNIHLHQGTMVEIYLDYKNKTKFEGRALLIEKRDIGDTYYMDHEELNNSYGSKSSLRRTTSAEKQLQKLWEYMEFYCNSSNELVKQFKAKMKSLCNTNLDSYNKMYEEITKWKDLYLYDPHYINNILRVETMYIIRYFQQKFIKNWKPTLFRCEKWLVEFPVQRNPSTGEILFNSPFRTTRWIGIVVCIAPTEDSKSPELLRYTTYNGRSIADFGDHDDDYND